MNPEPSLAASPSPLLGIALAAYDPDPQHFLEQLQSIQAQTHTNWVCVITLDVRDSQNARLALDELKCLPSFHPIFSDSRFHWVINDTRLGHKKNFEKATSLCLAKKVAWIACSDQDDLWYPEKLSEGLKVLREAQNKSPFSIFLSHSDMHILGANLPAKTTAWDFEHRGVHNTKPHHLMVRNVLAGCSMIFSPELIKKHPTIPQECEFHDHWYALLASTYGEIIPIHTPLYAYRQHPNNELGVTPYLGFFQADREPTLRLKLTKCKSLWLKSHRLAWSLKANQIPLAFSSRVLFLSRLDLGLGLLFLALYHRRADPALSRACLARFIGKLIWCFAPVLRI